MRIKKGIAVTICLAVMCLAATGRGGAEDKNEETLQITGSSAEAVDVYRVQDIVVTAREAEKRSLPYSVDITGAEEIEANHKRTLPEIIQGKPGIASETDGSITTI